MADFRTGTDKYKIMLGYLAVTESKEVLGKKKAIIMRSYQRKIRVN